MEVSDLLDRRWRIPLGIFLLALAVRLLYLAEFTGNPFFIGVHPAQDGESVRRAAEAFARGDWALYDVYYKYPFYSYIVSLLFMLPGPDYTTVWLFQFVLGAAASAMIYSLGRHAFGRRAGLAAAIIYAVYPPNLFYEGVFLRASTTEFLVVLSCLMLMRVAARPSWGRIVVAGLTASAVVQCRENLVLMGPFALWWVWAYPLKGRPVRDRLARTGMFVGVAVLAAAPLLVRGILLAERFVFFHPQGPATLLMGNLPTYEGHSWSHHGPTFQGVLAAHGNDIWHDYGLVARVLLRAWLDDPLAVLRLYGRKLYYLLAAPEVPSNYSFALFQRFSRILRLPLGDFGLLVALAGPGLALARRRWPRGRATATLVAAGLAGTFLSTILFYNVARLRLPMVPLVILPAGASVVFIVDALRQRRVSSMGFAILWVVAAALVLRAPDVQRIRCNDADLLAAMHERRGQSEAAIAMCREAVAIDAAYVPSHRGLAQLLIVKKRYAEALPHLRRAIKLSPGEGRDHYLMALAEFRLGNTESARIHLAAATRLGAAVHPEFRTELEGAAPAP